MHHTKSCYAGISESGILCLYTLTHTHMGMPVSVAAGPMAREIGHVHGRASSISGRFVKLKLSKITPMLGVTWSRER
jgi:hypothetical protein